MKKKNRICFKKSGLFLFSNKLNSYDFSKPNKYKGTVEIFFKTRYV